MNTNKLKQILTFQRKEEGFTLTEILIGIAVFAILTAIAVPIYLNHQNNLDKNALKASLISASVIVGQEKEANNGLYPVYTPPDMLDDVNMEGFIYTYNNSRDEYCVEGSKNNVTLFIGSATDFKVSEVNCSLGNIGITKPAPPGDNIPPTTNAPYITTILPESQIGLDGGAVVSLLGENFVASSKVNIGDKTVNATVETSGSLTFVVPEGFTLYEKVNVQVVNSNTRISNSVEYDFIDPIIQFKPEPPVWSSWQLVNTTGNAITYHPVVCPDNSSPEYYYNITREGDIYDISGNGLFFTDYATNKTTNEWHTSNVLTYYPKQGVYITMIVKAVCASNVSSYYSQVSDWSNQYSRTSAIFPPTPNTPLSVIPEGNYAFAGEQIIASWDAYSQCPEGTTFKEYSIRRSNSSIIPLTQIDVTNNTTYTFTADNDKAVWYVYPRCETRFTIGSKGYISKTVYTIIPVTPTKPTATTYTWSKAEGNNKALTLPNGCTYTERLTSGASTKYSTPFNTIYRINPDGTTNTVVALTSNNTYTPNITSLANGQYKYYFTQYCKSSSGATSPVLTSPVSDIITITN